MISTLHSLCLSYVFFARGFSFLISHLFQASFPAFISRNYCTWWWVRRRRSWRRFSCREKNENTYSYESRVCSLNVLFCDMSCLVRYLLSWKVSATMIREVESAKHLSLLNETYTSQYHEIWNCCFCVSLGIHIFIIFIGSSWDRKACITSPEG